MFQREPSDSNPVILLLEDALKMPFNVFGTKHKRSFLKWYQEATGIDMVLKTENRLEECTVLDVADDGTVSLLGEDSETRDIVVSEKDVLKKLRTALKRGDDASVTIEVGADEETIVDVTITTT